MLDAHELRKWTPVSRWRNLASLLRDYAIIGVIQVAAVFALTHLDNWNQSLFWAIPIVLVTVILTGCLMHRIGLMGHESSHYLLVPNRKWNDFLADLLCFFPLWSSLASYRDKHGGHHRHPNDPELDPNLGAGKAEKLYSRFPMPYPSFIFQYYLKFFWPPFVFRNLMDLLKVLSVGAPGESTQESGRRMSYQRLMRSPNILGLLYLLALVGVIYAGEATGKGWLVISGPIGFYAVAVMVWAAMPRERWGRSQKRLSYDAKLGGLARMTMYTGTFWGISWIRHFGGFDLAPFYLMFWIFPLVYVFPYLMLLREIYQHANLGEGPLNNSRIIYADPFTRWALLAYGNDYHLVHHIYPNIPHYNLREAHLHLADHSPEYRENAEESHGTFVSRPERVSLLESLTR